MVVDAMTGQDVVNVASAFAAEVDFDGVIMSKMDGDARGGGALSIKQETGKPIKFISSGEKPDSLEEFHPDRMAKRILGMGDVVTFIEQAVKLNDEQMEAEEARRLAKADITLDDFIEIQRKINKVGGVRKLISSLPGGDEALRGGQVDEGAFDRMVIIINSMTKQERRKPDILNGSRRLRIAKGAGTTVQEVNQVIKRFNETKKMAKRAMAAQSTKKGKGRRRGMPLPGMGGMSAADLRGLSDLLDK